MSELEPKSPVLSAAFSKAPQNGTSCIKNITSKKGANVAKNKMSSKKAKKPAAKVSAKPKVKAKLKLVAKPKVTAKPKVAAKPKVTTKAKNSAKPKLTTKPIIKQKVAPKSKGKPEAKGTSRALPVVTVKKIDVSKFITPLDDRLIVQPLAAERMTAGGLYIPDTAAGVAGNLKGVVVSAGRGHRDKKGRLRPMDVKAGDQVVFAEFSGSKINIQGQDLMFLRETDILGILS
ncbi:MAG: co-chaperone GroES [Bdellovibrionaceae bacterium]|nr:co-chaperone GroES [Pseudobdellovibrionaceae bacterium]